MAETLLFTRRRRQQSGPKRPRLIGLAGRVRSELLLLLLLPLLSWRANSREPTKSSILIVFQLALLSTSANWLQPIQTPNWNRFSSSCKFSWAQALWRHFPAAATTADDNSQFNRPLRAVRFLTDSRKRETGARVRPHESCPGVSKHDLHHVSGCHQTH